MYPKKVQRVNPSIRSTGVLAILLLMLTTVSHGFAETVQSAPANKAFVEYLYNMLETNSSMEISHQETQVVRPTKLIPSPIDRSHQRGLAVTPPQEHLMKAMVSVMNTPPASYDLRTLGKVTPVRDQGNCGSCWTFGTMASLESSQEPNAAFDFSEHNLNDLSGFDTAPCQGGNSDMASAYLARWSGPVAESADPYNDTTTTSPIGLPSIRHVQDVMSIPDRAAPLDNNNIKIALQTYGALYTTMYYQGDSYNASTYSYYYNGTSNGNHAVAIVGWDDNYSRSNFQPSPAGDGAFIVKNSWGTAWGQQGYFYVSYYDTVFTSGTVAFLDAEPTTNYNTTYQYDSLGWVSSWGNNSTTGWFANIFTATASESLTAVSIQAASPNSTYTIYVYTNITGAPTSGTLADTSAGTTTYSGYTTIPLSNPVPLTIGQKFSVVVKLTTPGYNWPVPISTPYSGYSSKATNQAGHSFISSNGTSWTDAITIQPNTSVCIKAFAGGWSQLPGDIISKPALAWNPISNNIQMVVQGSNNSVWTSTFNSDGFFDNDWTRVPGTILSSPAIVWNSSANKMQMIAQGGNNTIWSASFNSAGTFNNDWTQVSGAILSSPTIAWNPISNNIQMVVQGSNNSVWTSTLNSNGSFDNDWTRVPGTILSSPAIVWNSSANKMQMIAQGGNNTIWSASFNSAGTFNNDWTQVPGAIISPPALSLDPVSNTIQLLVRGSGNAIWTATFNSAGLFNADWTNLPGAIIDPPAIVWNPVKGVFLIVVRGTNNTIWAMEY